ncbi:RNA polymerase sigma factor [Paenibacillus sp. J2TS4]|uniref:RNA polymerase sigma factor n=1 Tax=Paenibacillus sp. J2TS4 TaxID=2807194 RepID=UPI001B1455E9|nr:RNA polymerase sigma factor [Paenibacillus sp. J2TS4]GIP34965.1 hypothetical protein J2TS4_41750 [Paenibacillus sp. J2TS4]
MEEATWIRRIQQGETHYLTLLIERHYASIQKYCYWRVRDQEEAKDLTQETFYRFCRHIERYTDAGKCRAYLYTIARHLCSDHMGKWRALPWEEAGGAAEQRPSMEERVDNEHLVHQLLQTLPEEQRELIFMRFCLDLTFRDIARITGVNICMVQYRVKRGLNALKQHWERREAHEQATESPCPRYSEGIPFTPH